MNGKRAKQLRKELFNMPFNAAMLNYRTDRNGATRCHPGSYRGLYLAFKTNYKGIQKTGHPDPMGAFRSMKNQILEELTTA